LKPLLVVERFGMFLGALSSGCISHLDFQFLTEDTKCRLDLLET
jgi:hypothetical protein